MSSRQLRDECRDARWAKAVLGAALLVSRVAGVSRLLGPLAAAGAYSLALYTAHLGVLATGVLDDHPTALYLGLVAGALVLAPLWRSCRGPGHSRRSWRT